MKTRKIGQNVESGESTDFGVKMENIKKWRIKSTDLK